LACWRHHYLCRFSPSVWLLSTKRNRISIATKRDRVRCSRRTRNATFHPAVPSLRGDAAAAGAATYKAQHACAGGSMAYAALTALKHCRRRAQRHRCLTRSPSLSPLPAQRHSNVAWVSCLRALCRLATVAWYGAVQHINTLSSYHRGALVATRQRAVTAEISAFFLLPRGHLLPWRKDKRGGALLHLPPHLPCLPAGLHCAWQEATTPCLRYTLPAPFLLHTPTHTLHTPTFSLPTYCTLHLPLLHLYSLCRAATTVYPPLMAGRRW